MKVKSFFMIVVRIIGLFVLIDVFKLFPTTIPQLSTMKMNITFYMFKIKTTKRSSLCG